jgi:uncharacterized protein YozE (UPF0346 family)
MRAGGAARVQVNARKLSSLESLTADSSFPKDETDRRTINSWIRTSGAFDAVIDFDATWGDPANPSQIIDALQAGDHAEALATMFQGCYLLLMSNSAIYRSSKN